MTAEARVDEDLFSLARFGELEEEDAGREIVDILDSEGGEGEGELGCDDADIERGEALLHYGRRKAAETDEDGD
jgi:hypothetical protein